MSSDKFHVGLYHTYKPDSKLTLKSKARLLSLLRRPNIPETVHETVFMLIMEHARVTGNLPESGLIPYGGSYIHQNKSTTVTLDIKKLDDALQSIILKYLETSVSE